MRPGDLVFIALLFPIIGLQLGWFAALGALIIGWGINLLANGMKSGVSQV